MTRHSRRSAARGRVRYSWHGFYLPTPSQPGDTLNDVFVLYDPLDDDHQEEVVHERTILHYTVVNPSATTAVFGIGVYAARRDSAGGMVSDIDPLGNTAFDIESNNQLFNRTHLVRPQNTGAIESTFDVAVDIKGRRKIQDPAFLVLVTRVSVLTTCQFTFTARSLVREGRF